MVVTLALTLLFAPELVPQTPHSGSLTHVAISDDHRTVASRAINDKRVRVWDVATGLVTRTIDVDWCDAMTFAGSQHLLVGSTRQVDLFDVATGARLAQYNVGAGPHIRATPDGRYGLVATNQHTLERIDLTRRGDPRYPTPGATKSVATPFYCMTPSLSDDGRTGLCVGNMGPVAVVDFETGVAREIPGIKAATGAISGDGKDVVLLSTDYDEVTRIDVPSLATKAKTKSPAIGYDPTGNEWADMRVSKDEVIFAYKKHLRRFRRDTLKLQGAHQVIKDQAANGQAFDRSGELFAVGVQTHYAPNLLSASRGDKLAQVALFQTRDARDEPARVLDVPMQRVPALAWSDSGVLLAQRFRNRARVTNLSSSRIVWEDTTRPALGPKQVGAAAMSRSGRYAAFASSADASDMFIVDLATKKVTPIEPAPTSYAPSLITMQFGPSERFLLIDNGSKPRFVDVTTGKTRYTHPRSGNLIVAFAERAPRVLVGPTFANSFSSEPTVLVDLDSGNVLTSVLGAAGTLAPDGALFTSKLHADEKLPLDKRKRRRYASDGKELETQDDDYCETRANFIPFENKVGGGGCRAISMVWSEAPKAVVRDIGKLEILSASGSSLFSLPQQSPVLSLGSTPDGKKLLVHSVDGDVLLVDVETKRAAARVIVGQEDWVVVSDDGYYASAKGENRLIGIRDGSKLYGFRDLDQELNRPDLVLARIGAKGDVLTELERAAKKRRERLGAASLSDRPSVRFVGEALPLSSADESLTLQLRGEAKPGHSLKALHVWVNDVPARGRAGLVQSGGKPAAEASLSITLSPGYNRIDVAAEDERGTLSLRETWLVTRQEPKRKDGPARYVLAIGVSDYKNDELDLSYAAKDAEDIAKSLEATQVKVLRDGEVTRESIRAARGFFAQAKVEDELVVFLAGHGFLDAKDDYWFGAHDIDAADPTTRGVPLADIEELFDDSAARKRWLLLDTCHSGEVDRDMQASVEALPQGVVARAIRVKSTSGEKRSATNVSRFLGDLFADLRPGVGATVLTSSSGMQLSQESATYKNGLFTYALLSALQNPTLDTNESGAIELDEVRDGVLDTVRTLSGGLQVPNARRENYEANFAVRVVTKAPEATEPPPARAKKGKKKR